MSSTTIDRVTGLSTSVAVKAPCRVATTANITLSGLQTIDGVTVVADDRVLVKNQTSSADNGIYYASASAWTRTEDFDAGDDVVSGTAVFVRSGTVGANNWFQATVASTPPVIGTTAITWAITYVSLVAVTTPPTETIPGTAEIATQAEVTTGTSDTTIVTPLKLKVALQALPYDASIVSTDAGATSGPKFTLYRNSASPAASDVLGIIEWDGKDSAGNVQNYGTIEVDIIDATSTSEDSKFVIKPLIAGTATASLTVGPGVLVGAATSGDQGVGTVNATAYYTNGTRSDPGTYLENTFTPAVAFGGASTGVTYTTQVGSYTRVGNRVLFNIRIVLTSNGSATGACTITGLPIAAAGGQIQTVSIRAISGWSTLSFNPVASIASGATVIDIYQGTSTGTSTVSDTNVTDTASFVISGSYQV